jgi:hypothetical protein
MNHGHNHNPADLVQQQKVILGHRHLFQKKESAYKSIVMDLVTSAFDPTIAPQSNSSSIPY